MKKAKKAKTTKRAKATDDKLYTRVLWTIRIIGSIMVGSAFGILCNHLGMTPLTTGLVVGLLVAGLPLSQTGR